MLPRLIASQAPAHDTSPVLHTATDLPLTGPAVRFDYQYLDTVSNRLYLAHIAVDPRTHLVYFPLQDVNGRPVLRIMAGTPPAA